ncbi:hypothetical protein DMP06_00400 [Slackia equolifaciens]|uniref:HTH luxR-type domain-containing protein n=1 Tax=Slackia equolifaciens TaxID=498718 RepID=A0A3N0B4T5_9ACTN|nr:LuxR family transcriptional regulator [Slackia equolifaciens]RNL41910.1 hypothetical protein DMP06_00400 [Slackia equolifaciens]
MAKLIHGKDVAIASFGFALAMALSSLVLWESGWAVSADLSAFSVHGIGVLTGTAACIVAFAWSCLHPKTLAVALLIFNPACMLVASCGAFAMAFFLNASPNVIALNIVLLAGAYLLIFAWFAVAAMRDIENALMILLLAWFISAPLRAVLGLAEDAVARRAIVVCAIAFSWLLLIHQWRRADVRSPMVLNVPRENKMSYVHALRSMWKCVLIGGAFAFLGGVIRSLSLQADVMSFVNVASILGGCIAAAAIAAIWRFRTVKFSINRLFCVVFPLLVVALCALPFCGVEQFAPVAAVLYILYSFSSLALQVLCVQTAHDYGVNPLFCISLQIGASIIMQGAGYALGPGASALSNTSGVDVLTVIALVTQAVMALVLYAVRGISVSFEEEGRDIEFISLSRQEPIPVDDAVLDAQEAQEEREGGSGPQKTDDAAYADRLAMRCDLVGRKYCLSQREVEILGYFARGYTMASIAEELFISNNTVKTHVRRLYAKLGIHKKQELLDIVNNYVE